MLVGTNGCPQGLGRAANATPVVLFSSNLSQASWI
jgi:hypothetical protein